MGWLGKKINNLQSRPYEERIKVLKTSIAIVVILILAIWFTTLKFRKNSDAEKSGKFQPIIDSLKKFGEAKP